MHVSAPIFSHLQGWEMRLWDQLTALDMVEALLIWIVATNGPDGNAVRGLCRTLAKELLAWKIHLIICKAALMHISVPIFSYLQGWEMRLQDQLVALDVAEALSIWIVATNSLDSNAAHGLCRTLAKELPVWKIHLIICEAVWTAKQRHTTIGSVLRPVRLKQSRM